MEFKSILLLGIFLVVATKVSSYDEDLKIQGNYAKPPAPVPAPATAPTPPTAPLTPPPSPVPVKAPPPPLVKSPSYPPPLVKSPPYPPPVKGPSPPPYVKTPTPPPVAKPPLAPSPSTPIVKSTKDCIPLCTNRCQLHSRTRVCMRACMTCCDRCKCVPPGTYGNREKCGKCYTDMITHGGRSKCP